MVGRGTAEPAQLLDELEIRIAGIEIMPDQKRKDEGDDRRPQGGPAHIAQGNLVIAADRQDKGGADKRQEGDDGEDRPGHQWALPNMNHVTRAATPISMAKA